MPTALPLALLLIVSLALAGGGSASSLPAQSVVALLSADRDFAERARTGTAREVYARMLSDQVKWQGPQGFVSGRDAALRAFDATPDAATSRFSWSPVRAGVSADGDQGYTFGFMRQHRADGTTVPLKYMAYWVKRGDVWHVVAYKRTPASGEPTDTAAMPHDLPPRGSASPGDATTAHYRSLMDAERQFAAEARRSGLGNAFAQFGRPDAVNMGGQSPDFVRGNLAIARLVAPGGDMSASPVTWGPDTAIVASSGDLGVTFGRIVPNGETREIPFFTIWRREHRGAPWRYVAE
jgi:ketosteroid isomerase-like protein